MTSMPGGIGYELRVPYYSRREIDKLGALRGRGLEIAWVKDPIDLFFLHIQGSGLLRLRDGRQVTVGYAAQNGWPYRSIGRLLIDDGKVAKEEMSMQRLRRYLTENPREQDEIFAYNESYVFFRLTRRWPAGQSRRAGYRRPIDRDRCATVSQGRVGAGRKRKSRSSTRKVSWPAGGRSTRFVLNQDTGGAIRGPAAGAIIYFGTGDEAGALAGYMNRQGKLYFLVLKQSSNGITARQRRRKLRITASTRLEPFSRARGNLTAIGAIAWHGILKHSD